MVGLRIFKSDRRDFRYRLHFFKIGDREPWFLSLVMDLDESFSSESDERRIECGPDAEPFPKFWHNHRVVNGIVGEIGHLVSEHPAGPAYTRRPAVFKWNRV